MNFINSYNIRYSNHLLGSESLVLRGDELRGDAPLLEVYSQDNLDLVLMIKDGINVEDMISDSKKGAKDRFDIHIAKNTLNSLLKDLEKYKKKSGLVMDTKSITLHDPTGKEHSTGLPLGDVQSLTRIPAKCSVSYLNVDKVAQSNTIYIDAENYPNKARFHIGAPTYTIGNGAKDNSFKILIPSEYVCRFIKTVELAIIILK